MTEQSVHKVSLNGDYEFMYQNFVVSTQHEMYLLLEKSNDKVKGLKFRSSVFKYGYPNDEISHPLSQHGLGYYGLFQVHNSSWVAEMRALNSQHPQDSEALHKGKEHYVAIFKDVCLEVIASEFCEVELSMEDFGAIIAAELEGIRSIE